MSVWVLHSSNADVAANQLSLPFEGLPDLTSLQDIHDCKRLIQLLQPESSPESRHVQVDRIWHIRSQLHADDIIAVPSDNQVLLFHVNGGYQYEVGKDGADIHSVPVTWQKTVPLSRFGKHQAIFTPGRQKMLEVSDKEARVAIHDKLPRSYNRFAGLKWLVIILFGIQVISMLMQQFGH